MIFEFSFEAIYISNPLIHRLQEIDKIVLIARSSERTSTMAIKLQVFALSIFSISCC